MVHGAGQNGFLAVVESGAEYASIIATPALTNNPFTTGRAARFEYRQKYMMNINRKEGSGALMPQPDMNASTQDKLLLYRRRSADYDGYGRDVQRPAA